MKHIIYVLGRKGGLVQAKADKPHKYNEHIWKPMKKNAARESKYKKMFHLSPGWYANRKYFGQDARLWACDSL